jgi:hypothetical protein
VVRRQESDRVRAGEFELLLDSYGVGEGVGIFHHTIAHGPDGRWHLFGSAGAESDRYHPSRVKQLVHASAPALSGPWSWHGVVMEASAAHGEEFINEPKLVVHDGRFYLFYVGSGTGFPGWERGVCHWEAGRFTAMEGCTHGPFDVHLATSADGRDWQRQGIVVSDAPFAAGPSVHRIEDRWVMYYGSAEPAATMGKHAIVYRTSDDLIRWSRERGVAFLDSSPTTPWPEHPFLRDPVVLRRGATWYLFTGSVNNDNLSRYHVLWPFTSQSPFRWEHSASPPHGRLFVDGGAEILRDRDGRWFVSSGTVLSGGVWLAPLHWQDGEDDDDTSVPLPR